MAEPSSTSTSDSDEDLQQPPYEFPVIMMPDSAFTQRTPHAAISNVLYMNRCVGGCTITGGTINDSRTSTSSIPNPGATKVLGEFQDPDDADAAWNAVVACVKEIYSPFNVTVTDVKPTSAAYHMAIVAGLPTDLDLPSSVGGISPSQCSPIDNNISFTFSNSGFFGGSGMERWLRLCFVVGQESAHSFGLPDHEWAFSGGRSACNDPMSYRENCGGQKFFRNEAASCGDFAEGNPPCQCGTQPNSHLKLLGVFGEGTPTYGLPTAAVTLPVAGGQLGAVVGVQAGSKRGVAKVELLINGYKWSETPGAAFGVNGQPNPSSYTLQVPSNLPGGVVDVVARACDDLGDCSESPVVTATKGAPCTSADSCAAGQKCEAGKCFWDPPTGEIGDSCGFDQACLSGRCSPTAEDRICTQTCAPGVASSCPENYECLQTTAGNFCYIPGDSGGGCCSVGGGPKAVYLHGLLSALVFGFLVFRRRRR